MVRAFIGCRLDAAAHERLVSILAAFRERMDRRGARASYTRPENLHVTLSFLGDVDDAKLPAVGDALARAAEGHHAFGIRLDGLGSFPPHRPPRIVYADVTDGRNEFIRLAQSVSAACAQLGFEPERRPFHPHVTLARIKPGPRIALADVTPPGASAGEALVEHVTLYRSETGRTGPVYTALRDVVLS